MAEMVPDRLPTRASKGEQKLFSVLQRLPDDYIVYYEPVVENRYPDFIVIGPDLGLLVIEVKGWYPKDIIAADSNTVVVNEYKQQVRRDHPIRQARDYMLALMDKCRKHRAGQRLLQKEGEFANKFIFPFGHFAVLSNITSSQLSSHPNGDLTTIFSPNKVATRDMLETWMNESLTTENLCSIFQSYFDPIWKIERLTEAQIDALRAIIHPEIILQPPQISETATLVYGETVDLKVLDLKQENNARKIGEGHRIVYGIAGSGKTVLLISKARLISTKNPDARILMLCYNVTLASYLKAVLGDCKNIKVFHFDGWAKANRVIRHQEEQDEALGNRLLKALENGAPDTRIYDVVMVDEAQDFESSWFKCILEAMREPNDGDLIIVGDGSQGLYARRKLSWKKIGIHARGRTISAKFDLDKNYRNSREIIELAAVFASQSQGDEEDTITLSDTILAVPVDPDKCIRRTGIKPTLVMSIDKAEESSKVAAIVKNLLDGQWFGRPIQPLKPSEIAILYPLAPRRDKGLLRDLMTTLQEIAPVVWLNDPNDRHARTKVTEPGIKIQTIHSAKGL